VCVREKRARRERERDERERERENLIAAEGQVAHQERTMRPARYCPARSPPPCLSVCLCLCLCLSLCPLACLHACLSVCPPVCLHICAFYHANTRIYHISSPFLSPPPPTKLSKCEIVHIFYCHAWIDSAACAARVRLNAKKCLQWWRISSNVTGRVVS
jgi:hypothetical protein